MEFDSGDFINPADAHFPGNRLYSVDYQFTGDPPTLTASGIRRTSIPVAGGPASGVTQLLSVSNLVTNVDRPSAIRVSPSSGVSFDVVWIGTRQGRLYRLNSVQSGTTITAGNIQDLTGSNFPIPGTLGGGTTGRRISSINFGPTENHILVTFTQYNTISVFESRDGGTTWQNREGNLPNIPVRWAVYNPLDPTLSQVILATEAGIYVTDNINTASPSWSTTPGFPTVRTDMLRIRTATNTLFAYTHGRGVFSAPLPTVTSNEGPNLTIEAVDVFPNPATTQARVRGTLKRPSAVSFQISDLSGRTRIQRSLGQVATFDETVILTSLSAGSYMLTVRAGEEVKTTRLVVR
ncbi:MAG: T9SS type A sorting domain-containing protein [Bacteroidia bacterium]|nr:T9SS type A sorting domain-containing protein [Bacteroidia bacterium]